MWVLAKAADDSQSPEPRAQITAPGPLQSVTFVEVGRWGDDIYAVKFAEGELRWAIVLDEGGKVRSELYDPTPD